MLDTQLRNLMKNNSFSLTAFRDITNVEDGSREFKNVTCDCCNFTFNLETFMECTGWIVWANRWDVIFFALMNMIPF